MSSNSIWSRVLQGVLGALGFYAAVRFLPRLLRTMTRRFFLGLIGEILILAFSLVMTKRATSSRNGTSDRTRNGTASASPLGETSGDGAA